MGTGHAEGLEGVVAAHTRLSDVDGEHGRLIIAGEDVERLAFGTDFAGVTTRLFGGDGAETAGVLGDSRVRAFERLGEVRGALAIPDGMEALRACVARLHGPERFGEADAAELTGAVAVYAAAWQRVRAGLAPVAPEASAGHAADYLRMARGTGASDAEAAALDAYLVTVSDHGMNASTFAARVVVSTGSDLVSAVVAAIGALKGPLHGGAPGPVLDMLDAVGSPENARKWLTAELAAGRRIMGMGHRIYRVRDPRAAVLERAIERLEAAGVAKGRLALARSVERTAEALLAEAHPDRPLKANVEFYTAVLLDALGLPREAFTPTFAVGRVAGWCAHGLEQRATGRLIRPASRYVGPVPASM